MGGNVALAVLFLAGALILGLQLRQELHEPQLPFDIEQQIPADAALDPAAPIEVDGDPGPGNETEFSAPEPREILVVNANGRPVPGARVSLGFGDEAPRWESEKEARITDENGRIRALITTAFGFWVRARKDGVGLGEMLEDTEKGPILIRLHDPLPATRVSGVVLGADGKAVPTARVKISRSDVVQSSDLFTNPERAVPLTTDAAGRFSVDLVSRSFRRSRLSWSSTPTPPLGFYAVRAEAGDDWSPDYFVETLPGGEQKLVIHLFGHYRITGQVEDGEGAGEITVRYREARGEKSKSRFGVAASLVTCDEAGRFAINVPGPGRYELVASRGRDPQFAYREVEVTEEDPRVSPVLSFGPTAHLEGRLLDENGNALPGVAVDLSPALAPFLTLAIPPLAARTDAQGRFHFAELSCGREWILRTHPIGDHPEVVTTHRLRAAPGSAPVTIRLGRRQREGVSISGRLHDDAPVASYRVQAVTEHEDNLWAFSDTVVVEDAQGRFQTPPMAPGGRSWLIFRGMELEDHVAQHVVGPLSEDELRSPVTLKLPRIARMKLRVIDAEDRPMPHAFVFVQPPKIAWETTWTWSELCDAEGRLTIDELPPGRYRIRAGRTLRSTGGELTLDLGPGETKTLDLRLPPR